jgi:HlyD family secretion protein
VKSKKSTIALAAVIAAIIIVLLLLIFCVFNRKPRGITGSGMIEVMEVQISARIGGQIQMLNVKEGNNVRKGDTIMIIDHHEMIAQEKAASAGLVIAEQALQEIKAKKGDLERNVERIRGLHETGDVPDNEYEAILTQWKIVLTQETRADASLKVARAQLELIQAQIAYAYIVSPLSGVLLALNYDKGETVFPGSVIAEVGDLQIATLKIFVPEQDIGKITYGQSARVFVDAYPAQVFEGKVSWIASESEFTPRNIQTRDERAQLVFAVKIIIPNESQKLLPGMPADAQIVDHGNSRQ